MSPVLLYTVMPSLRSSASGSLPSLPRPLSRPAGISVLVWEVAMISRNRSRAWGLSLSPMSTRAMVRARSRLLDVLVPSRSGSQLFSTVACRPLPLKLAFTESLPPSCWITRLVALLSLTRIISVAASYSGKRVPIGLLPIQPAPPPTSSLVSCRGWFQRSLPLSSASRATSRIGVLIELAAGIGWSALSWAKRPSSSTSRKPVACRSFWAAASCCHCWLRAVSSLRASKLPALRPRGVAAAVLRPALALLPGSLIGPSARWGASRRRPVPVITPRPTPITIRRSNRRTGWPQLLRGGRAGRPVVKAPGVEVDRR